MPELHYRYGTQCGADLATIGFHLVAVATSRCSPTREKIYTLESSYLYKIPEIIIIIIIIKIFSWEWINHENYLLENILQRNKSGRKFSGLWYVHF